MSPVSFATPEDAEVAFYAAFERGDVEAMMTVWAEDDQAIVCVHPLGPVLAGREAVKQSWQTIFARSPGIKFTIAPQLQAIDSRLALHVVHEHIQLSGEERRRHTVSAGIPSLPLTPTALPRPAGVWSCTMPRRRPRPKTCKLQPCISSPHAGQQVKSLDQRK
jgi:ketosteroid isomerase-like protein